MGDVGRSTNASCMIGYEQQSARRAETRLSLQEGGYPLGGVGIAGREHRRSLRTVDKREATLRLKAWRFKVERQVVGQMPIGLRSSAGRMRSRNIHGLPTGRDLDVVLGPVRCVVGRRRDKGRGDILIADFCRRRLSDGNADTQPRAKGAAASGEAEAADPDADGWGWVVEDVGPAHESDACGRIAGPVSRYQSHARRWLKATDPDLHGVLLPVILRIGAVRRRQPWVRMRPT